MFLTWRLWEALQNPPRQQAIYRYVRKLSNTPTELSIIMRVLLAIFCVGIVALGFINPSILFGLVLVSITLIPIGLLVFSSTIQGLYWFRNTSQRITAIQGVNQSELIYLTPHSTLGIVWMIAVSCVNDGDSFHRITRVIQLMVLIILGMLSVSIGILLWGFFSSASGIQQSLPVIGSLVYAGFFAVGIWVDFVQSIITSVLLAMITPTYTKDKFLLANILPIFFLFVQVGIYLVTVIAFSIFQLIFTNLFGTSILSALGISTITLLSFYFTRETIISVMWQVIQRRYDARLNIFSDDVS